MRGAASGPPESAQNGQGNQVMKYNMSGRGFASVARAAAVAAALCFAVSALVMAADQPPTNAPTATPASPSAPATTPTGETAAPASSGPTKDFTEEDVNAAVKKTVDERSKDGVFIFHDPRLDEDLNLVYEQIKIVRGMEGYGWFANTIFHDKDEAKKQYAIDFWFKPEGDKLTLMDIRVQKGPKQEGDSYVMVTRMPLDFVEIHQPVRHLKKEGEYFVCTDFRKPGSKDEYYDIDFWVNQKSGKLEVDNVKIHKVPVQEDGVWTQVPRYTFEGGDFDVTN